MFFISPEELFLFSRHLSFCLGFLVKYQNDLIKKIRLISNFMTSQPGQQTIVIHILPNISTSKDNQAMKFGLLIECNMWNIFLEKSYTKCGKETGPRPFSEKLKYLWIISLRFYTVSFYCMASWGLSKYIETKLQTTCFHLILSFNNNKNNNNNNNNNNNKRSGTSLLASFSA